MFFSGWIKKREEDHPLCIDRTGNRRPCNSFESTIINFSDCLEGYIKVIVEGTIKPLADNLDLKKVLMKDMMGSARGIAKLTQRLADSTMGALTTMMTTLNGLIGPSMSSDETQGSRTGGGGGAMFQAQIVLKLDQ